MSSPSGPLSPRHGASTHPRTLTGVVGAGTYYLGQNPDLVDRVMNKRADPEGNDYVVRERRVRRYLPTPTSSLPVVHQFFWCGCRSSGLIPSGWRRGNTCATLCCPSSNPSRPTSVPSTNRCISQTWPYPSSVRQTDQLVTVAQALVDRANAIRRQDREATHHY